MSRTKPPYDPSRLPMRFPAEESFALRLDAEDPISPFRDRFHIPGEAGGNGRAYFCGNSLGLAPKSAREMVEREMEDWANLGVDGHFQPDRPWYSYHEMLSAPMARLIGADPEEVVVMNGLTVNLHLMMVSFYRPTPERNKILIEAHPFPSDLYAVRSQARFHGFDPDESVVQVKPREGEENIRMEDIETILRKEGSRFALVFLSGVHYHTGQWIDMGRIAAAAREQGCAVGFDLAHAAGNVPMNLHDWDVDFAVWCTYKYLNGGPGAAAACFVHQRHRSNRALPRLAGWWGDDPATRFQMHRKREFHPQPGAPGWQVSNPPILSMAPLRAALDIFAEAGMDALRRKSIFLTAYLQSWLGRLPPGRFQLLTPREPGSRGCQLSFRVEGGARELVKKLREEGIVVDFRQPDVMRVAPVPLYNRFHDVWRLGRILEREAGPTGGRSPGRN